MSRQRLHRRVHLTEDEKILHRLGYAQELFRAMGAFRNFAISFTIISILAGCLTSYYLAFQWGGPVAVTWGWIIVGVFTTFVALSMAEIASTYPTAGGLYYWSSKLGSAALGLVHGLVQPARADRDHRRRRLRPRDLRDGVLQPLVELPERPPPHLLPLRASSWCGDAAERLRRADHLDDQRDLGLLARDRRPDHRLRLIIVPDHHQSAGYVFGQTVNNSGFSGHGWGSIAFFMVFAIGSIGMAQYTLTGLRRVGAHVRGDAQGVALGGGRDDLVGRRLGHRRLHPARRDHVRDPETRRACRRSSPTSRPTSGRRR